MTEGKKELTLGERVGNWAKALALVLPVVGAGLVGSVGYFKGDDAQQNVDSLIQQLGKRVAKQEKIINTQSDKLERMARRMIFFQGHQSGMSTGRLIEQKEALSTRLDQCRAKKASKTISVEKIAEIFKASRPKSSPASRPSRPTGDVTIQRIYSKPFRKTNGD